MKTHTVDFDPGAGLLRFALQARAGDFEEAARDEAIRHWLLAATFPDLPAGLLRKVAARVDGYSLDHDGEAFGLTTPSPACGPALHPGGLAHGGALAGLTTSG